MVRPGRKTGPAPAAGPVAAFGKPSDDRPAPLGIVGNFNADLVLGPFDRMPEWDEELAAPHGGLWTAGAAGYLALAARALGMQPRIVSTLGQDAMGRLLLANLQDLGIPTGGISVLDGEASPLSVVVVGPDGRRGILSVPGAHERMDLCVYRAHRDFLAGCAELVICGSYLLPALGPVQALEMARDAHAHGQVVAFDPSWDPAGWPEATRRATLDLLAEVDVYLPNEVELLRLTGASAWEEGLRQVTRLCPETVVKRGRKGSAAMAGLAAPSGGMEIVRVPAPRVRAVNSIGAGDCFDAAYFWARRQGWPVARRLAFANAYAGLVVSRTGREGEGGGSRYPTAEEALATGLPGG